MKQIITFILLLLTLGINAQSWDAIKKDTALLCGEGRGVTLGEADKNALSDLISKISVSISDKSDVKIENGDVDFKSVIKTYSSATLTNTERIIIKNEPNAQVGRWIKRSEIDKIFESRKAKINDLVESAMKAEERGKADDALRCYYWALVLTQSLQHPNEASYMDEDGNNHMLSLWIPEKLKGVLSDIKVVVSKIAGTDIDLLMTYKGAPVSSLDYTYFDGMDWSNVYSAKDGHGILELREGNTPDFYQLKFEYEYRSQAHVDKEMTSVLEAIPTIPMPSAYINVKAGTSEAKSVASAFKTHASTATNALKTLTSPDAGKATYVKIMDKVTKAIVNNSYESCADLFTEDGLDMYRRLIGYGNARIIGTPQYSFYQNGDEVVGRGAQMAFSFKTGLRKAFVEDVVFAFNSEGKISSISFGMGQTAETDILCKGVWQESARKAIMNFMENYKTAYALKRLDYIRSIFDDDAVIITGSVTKKSTMTKGAEGQATFSNDQLIKYNRQTKDEYLANLAKCFASNEFINIRFANNDVYKLQKGGEMYGIQIAQDYYSSNYGDKGYLFLIVDINNPKEPLIKVRTWQPEKDPNFGLYGPGDF